MKEETPKKIEKIFIFEDNVKGNLSLCSECQINFTSVINNVCPLCEARIKGDKKMLAEWKKILE